MSFALLAPDIAGMADAQARLREALGRDCRFYGPQAILWDPSIPASEFDDEGIPLDPLAAGTPVGSGAAVAVDNLVVVGSARANVLFQPLAAMRRDEVQEQRIAIRSRLNKDLILDIADREQVTGAEYFMVGTFARDVNANIVRNADGSEQSWTPDDGELWKIVNCKSDGFGALQRFVVFGQGSL
jgi:hypothetical protein